MFREYRSFQTICCAALCLVVAASVNAQITRIPIVDVAKNSRPSGAPVTRVRRPAAVRKVDRVVITRTEMVRVSNLTVTTEPGAKITLELAVKTGKPYKRDITADKSGNAIFDDLKPGVYKVEASKDEFEPEEVEKITISAQKAHGLNMDLKPITYRLKIDTNLTGGDILFAPAVNKGKDASGSIISEQLGNYCVVKIQPNGEAVIPDLKKGYYDIDIRPESLEYEQKGTGINVPEDIEQGAGASELKTFQIDLEKKISTETFSTTAWVPADWNLPQGFRLDRGMRVKNAEGVALPKNDRYRNYVKFEMIANVKLQDDGTVGFVLRAIDDKNYYLLQISGAKAAEPQTATLYLVKKGIMQNIASATTVSFAKTLTSANGFRIYIQNPSGEEFKVLIEDSDTGKVHGVGLLKDPFHTYKKGAVGIAALQRSNFEVNYFVVCTPSCPK